MLFAWTSGVTGHRAPRGMAKQRLHREISSLLQGVGKKRPSGPCPCVLGVQCDRRCVTRLQQKQPIKPERCTRIPDRHLQLSARQEGEDRRQGTDKRRDKNGRFMHPHHHLQCDKWCEMIQGIEKDGLWSQLIPHDYCRRVLGGHLRWWSGKTWGRQKEKISTLSEE